jgi:carbonic anhydrase
MGHQDCGAVNAVMKNQIQEIPFIYQMIKPAALKAEEKNPANLLQTTIKINAVLMAKFLKQLAPFKQKVISGQLSIYPAYYDFSTGKVQILARPPQDFNNPKRSLYSEDKNTSR